MKTYIEWLATKLANSSCWAEQFEVVQQLETERERCKDIIDQYKQREIDTWINCHEDVCQHENEIIKQINLILNK